MIERYSRPEMANIWSEENKYRAWLEVEILADEASLVMPPKYNRFRGHDVVNEATCLNALLIHLNK